MSIFEMFGTSPLQKYYNISAAHDLPYVTQKIIMQFIFCLDCKENTVCKNFQFFYICYSASVDFQNPVHIAQSYLSDK